MPGTLTHYLLHVIYIMLHLVSLPLSRTCSRLGMQSWSSPRSPLAGRVDIPEEIGNALRAMNEEQPRLTCVADIEAAHRRFNDLRTDASRTAKTLGQVERPDILSEVIFTPVWQQVCWLDTTTGETEQHKLLHATGEAEQFYRQLPRAALIGMEATGNCQ
jgi:hypothetical protein